MIAINLLRHVLADTRRLRRRRLWEGMIGLLSLGVVCLVLGLIAVNANHEIQSLQKKLAIKRVQVASQTRLESEVKALVEQKEKLMDGLSRFEDIQRLRKLPVNILDGISKSLDPLDLWLLTMQLEKGYLELTGVAGSREEILNFSKNIEDQSLFKDVIISETRAELIVQEPLYSFSMNLKVDTEYVNSTSS